MTQSVNFDRASDFYDETRAFPPEVEAVVGSFLAQAGNLQDADSVLEIGIGTGRIALPLAPHVGHITGVDISLQMMEQLRRKQNGEAIAVTQADALHLPFMNDTFDAGVIVHVLHLVSDPQQVLKEMARVLKPDGKLLHCNNRFPDRGSIEKLAVVRGDTGSRGHVTERYVQIDGLFEQLGWRKINRQSHEFVRYTTPRRFIAEIEGRVWSAMWRMSDADIAAMVAQAHAIVAAEFDGNLDARVDIQAAFDAIVYAPPAQA